MKSSNVFFCNFLKISKIVGVVNKDREKNRRLEFYVKKNTTI